MIYKHTDIYTATLKFVNDLRVKLGGEPLDELRPGERICPWNCPVANSLADLVEYVSVNSVEIEYRPMDWLLADKVIQVPGFVTEFIDMFDEEGAFSVLDTGR